MAASPVANSPGVDTGAHLSQRPRPIAHRPAPNGTLRQLAIAAGVLGLDRSEAIGFAVAVTGRRIVSRRQLSAREASAVLDALEQIIDTRKHESEH